MHAGPELKRWRFCGRVDAMTPKGEEVPGPIAPYTSIKRKNTIE